VKRDPLFFIALLPPADIQREVTAFKQYIASHWGPVHSLNSPPHLTLQPPVPWPETNLPALFVCLRKFVRHQAPFLVRLKNFGAFPPKVVFVEPVMSPELKSLFNNLVAALDRDLRFKDPRNDRDFHPHMTIAHRDLEEADFPAVWAHFKQQVYEREFLATSLALMESVKGKWEVREVFGFGR
jgi:2'-5' RNA ligase